MDSTKQYTNHNNSIEPITEIRMTQKRGKGVFASKNIMQNTIIESCQLIIFSEDEAEIIEKTVLSNYWYSWKEHEKKEYGALCLGNGCLYNHSSHPNAMVIKDYDSKLIHFIAITDIPKGGEITVKYGTVWFNEEEENN